MNAELQCPEFEIGVHVMSNYDHSIEEATAARLKENPDRFARYAGGNFNGRVWWTGTTWACEVWVHCVPRKIVTADSLREIMRIVSDEYGWE